MASSLKIQIYLQRKAENWVSTFVLLGCILITLMLVFMAYKADALGTQFSKAATVNVNSL